MTDSQLQQIQIRFDTVDQQKAFEWMSGGREAFEQAKDELAREGVEVSIEQRPSGGQTQERGFVEALLVGIAVEAITKLLFKIITIIFEQRRHPDDVVLQAGEHKIKLKADESEQSIRERLATWLQTGAIKVQEIVIRAFED